MANRTSSRGLNIFQQNGVSHNFFCGGKSGVKYKKLGASRFLAVSTHFFLHFLHCSHKKNYQDVEVMRKWLFLYLEGADILQLSDDLILDTLPVLWCPWDLLKDRAGVLQLVGDLSSRPNNSLALHACQACPCNMGNKQEEDFSQYTGKDPSIYQ